MSGQQPDVLPEQRIDETIFDGDFHIQIPIERLIERVDDPVIERKLENHGEPTGNTGGKKGAYASGHEQLIEGQSGATIHGQAYTTEDIVKAKEEMDLDYVLATPTPRGAFWGSARYPSMRKELIRAFNDYVIENVIDVGEGIYGSVMIPRWDPEASVDELDRVGSAKGVIGVSDWLSFEEPFGSIKYDPLLEKLVSLERPLMLHSAGEYLDRRSPLGEHFHSQTELSVSGTAFQAIGIVTNMIMTGVFDKYPDLDVLIQEAGTNWIPYIAYRTDEYYQVYGEDVMLSERLREMDQEYLQRMPSQYLFDNFYTTTQPIALPRSDQVADGLLTASRAEDMFVFSTDWPHGSLDTPKWVFENSAVDEDLRAAILYENAAELFGL